MANSGGGRPAKLPGGVWEGLFECALALIEEIARHGDGKPFWTLGGGTVLMLRYRHRISKDIDIFVPDPQYLGFVTPRLNGVAERVSSEYVEGANFVKLIRPEGEIDFVASPNLTASPFDTWRIKRRIVRVETPVEIIAKKLWHRGASATARDLFDLSLVIEHEAAGLRGAAEFLVRDRTAFLEQVRRRADVLRAQFEAIDALDYRPSFDEAAKRCERFLRALPSK